MEKIRVLLLGAGRRGQLYAKYLQKMDAVIVGVADPDINSQQAIRNKFNIEDNHCWNDWRDALKEEKICDAVIIALQDEDHTESALLAVNKGYHVLLEKPLALNIADGEKIAQAVKEQGTIFSLAHPMRYAKYTQVIKDLLARGRIGDLVTINHFEPVGLWRYLQNFVRGDWKNKEESTFFLMSKCCHDIDWLRFIVQSTYEQVASFGGLKHFKSENMPSNAGENCVECNVENDCPYSSKRFFLGKSEYRQRLLKELRVQDNAEEICEALKKSSHGRCVYRCNNNVVDHQVVAFKFVNGVVANFMATGFTKMMERETYFYGTHGYIFCDGQKLKVHDFLTDKDEIIDPEIILPEETDHHHGGDKYLLRKFLSAIINNDPLEVLANVNESLKSLKLIFKAEESRKKNKLIFIDK